MRPVLFKFVLRKSKGMAKTLPDTSAMYLTVHTGLCPFDKHLFHLFRTLRCRQLAGLGIDDARDDTGRLGKWRCLIRDNPFSDFHPDRERSLRTRQSYGPFVIESHPDTDHDVRRVPDE